MNLQEDIENKEIKYEIFSEELLNQYLLDIFGKDIDLPKNKIFSRPKWEGTYTWKNKIERGYLYKIGNNPLMLCTGYLGAINYGELLEKDNFTNDEIEESIQITQSEGIMTNMTWIPIKYITWYNLDK